MILVLFFVGCDKPTNKESEVAIKDTLPESKEQLDEEQEYNEQLLIPKSTEIEGYLFKFGYLSYDEDKFGWNNPGFLEVYRDNKLLFRDSVKGYDELFVRSLGFHSLSGKKLVFNLDFGTEACDFSQASRYYFISPEDSVFFIKEYWSQSTDYANRYFENIFPEDTNGLKDKLLILEGLYFKERDQPDKYDKTYIEFEKNRFKINKPTNNLDDGKETE